MNFLKSVWILLTAILQRDILLNTCGDLNFNKMNKSLETDWEYRVRWENARNESPWPDTQLITVSSAGTSHTNINPKDFPVY